MDKPTPPSPASGLAAPDLRRRRGPSCRAAALWSCGELAIRERRNFHRSFDLPERVIPDDYRRDLPLEESLPVLLLHALDGHGWATTGTLADTWRLKNLRPQSRLPRNLLLKSRLSKSPRPARTRWCSS